MASTVRPRRQAMWPSAWARKVLPTPTGPTIATCACASRKRSVVSSLRSARSKVTLDVGDDGEAVTPRRFVGEDEGEEVLMRQLLLPREDESLGQRVEHASELQAP